MRFSDPTSIAGHYEEASAGHASSAVGELAWIACVCMRCDHRWACPWIPDEVVTTVSHSSQCWRRWWWQSCHKEATRSSERLDETKQEEQRSEAEEDAKKADAKEEDDPEARYCIADASCSLLTLLRAAGREQPPPPSLTDPVRPMDFVVDLSNDRTVTVDDGGQVDNKEPPQPERAALNQHVLPSNPS